MRIAVFGAGIMGSGMVKNLLAAGHSVTVFNRTQERAAALEPLGAVVAENPARAASGADMLLTILSDIAAVDAVSKGPVGFLSGATAGSLWLQMSTIGVAETEELAERARDTGLDFVDAPVLGTKEPAEEGALLVLAGGAAGLLDRAEPVFDAIGKRTVRLPKAGDGTRLKLVVNTWVTGLTAVLAETLALAKRFGLDSNLFLDAIGGGPLDATYAGIKGKMMMAGDFPPSFPLRLAAKDVRLILAAATEWDLDLDVVPALSRAFSRAETAGHGDEDMAAVFCAYGS